MKFDTDMNYRYFIGEAADEDGERCVVDMTLSYNEVGIEKFLKDQVDSGKHIEDFYIFKKFPVMIKIESVIRVKIDE